VSCNLLKSISCLSSIKYDSGWEWQTNWSGFTLSRQQQLIYVWKTETIVPDCIKFTYTPWAIKTCQFCFGCTCGFNISLDAMRADCDDAANTTTPMWRRVTSDKSDWNVIHDDWRRFRLSAFCHYRTDSRPEVRFRWTMGISRGGQLSLCPISGDTFSTAFISVEQLIQAHRLQNTSQIIGKNQYHRLICFPLLCA